MTILDRFFNKGIRWGGADPELDFGGHGPILLSFHV